MHGATSVFILLTFMGILILGWVGIKHENASLKEPSLEEELVPTTTPDVIPPPKPAATSTEPVVEIEKSEAESLIEEKEPPPPEPIEIEAIQEEVVQPLTQEELDALIAHYAPTLEAELIQTPSFGDINISTRAAVVNILCTTKGSGPFSPISGSGVLVDSKGVILTNAHIAQYFLLEDYPTENFITCTIRTGSPAVATYNAELLHISPQWIEDNALNVTEERPEGTGEDDFALLRITEHVNKTIALPNSFPFIKPSIDESKIILNDPVLLAGYPASFLGGIAVQKDLYMSSTVTVIERLYTFLSSTIDLVSVGGSVVAQSGSSGGAVVSKENELLGIIVTSSDGNTTDERELRALMLTHINRSLTENSNISLPSLLAGDLAQKANDFQANIAPQLTDVLINVLE